MAPAQDPQSTANIKIVGVGDDGQDGLSNHARQHIENTQLLLGPANLLSRIDIGPDQRLAVDGGLDDLQRAVDQVGDRQAVLLAIGDPLFYGISRFLTESLGKDRFEVIPHVSSMQLAFARVKESWDDAYLANLAIQPLDRVVDTIRTAERVGLFTTKEITPAVVAAALLDRRIDYFSVYVCENLGTPGEIVTQGSLRDIRDQSFGSLNVMVLVRRRGAADRPQDRSGQRLFGNPDDAFLQSRPKRGLLTPTEVRCIALAELAVRPNSIVWDVGAGSGSLAIEAAMLAPQGQVYAIEMDAEDYALMIENARHFTCPALVPIHGQAPEAWHDLPDPDAIFVGGSGRVVPTLVRESLARIKPDGHIVINVSSPDNLVSVQQVLSENGWLPEVRMIHVSRGRYQLERTRLESLNPTFLVTGVRDMETPPQ